MLNKIILTIAALAIYTFVTGLYNPFETLILEELAGNQFANSNAAYVQTMYTFSLFRGINMVFSLVLFGFLFTLWYSTVKNWLIAAAAVMVFGLMLSASDRAYAYVDTTDKTEAYTILPNQTAFWVPDAGANKDSQAQFESEAYYNERKIAAKRYIIPHAKLSNSGGYYGWDYYVPTGRLYIVDRTPYSHEWVKSSNRGSSNGDQSFPCQTKEGLNVTAGVSVAASVTEEDAAKFLYNFGVNQPKGSPTDPQVIFASVYYGRSLWQVMDDVGRKKIQTLVCNEIGKRTFDQANADYIPMMNDIEKTSKEYFAKFGITINFIGWADTFEFDKEIQEAVNHRYEADKLGPVMATLQAVAQFRVQEGLATGMASHGLPMFVSPGIIEGLINLVPHVAASVPASK
jgi:hypothetical protein